jgi:hypothetical protein
MTSATTPTTTRAEMVRGRPLQDPFSLILGDLEIAAVSDNGKKTTLSDR